MQLPAVVYSVSQGNDGQYHESGHVYFLRRNTALANRTKVGSFCYSVWWSVRGRHHGRAKSSVVTGDY
jgi:hypothetical protein